MRRRQPGVPSQFDESASSSSSRRPRSLHANRIDRPSPSLAALHGQHPVFVSVCSHITRAGAVVADSIDSMDDCLDFSLKDKSIVHRQSNKDWRRHSAAREAAQGKAMKSHSHYSPRSSSSSARSTGGWSQWPASTSSPTLFGMQFGDVNGLASALVYALVGLAGLYQTATLAHGAAPARSRRGARRPRR